MTTNQRFLDISLPAAVAQGTVATLGPAGTSSEQAARYLISRLRGEDAEPAPKLFHSYEDASAAVVRGAADLLLVANAYANVAEFYMSATLKLAGAFYSRPRSTASRRCRTAPSPARSASPAIRRRCR